MPDLHLRVIGTRLLAAGKSPYFYHWKAGDEVGLYDPNIMLPNDLNGVTLTPFALFLHLPLLQFSYCAIRFIYFVLQEFFFFGTLFLTCLIPATFMRQLLTIIVAAIFFCFSRNWWLHIYNGQYYVLFAFIFSLSAYLSIRRKLVLNAAWLYPVVGLIRPFFLVALLPQMLKSKTGVLRLLVLASPLVVLGFVAVPLQVWKDYSKAMNFYSTEETGFTGKDHLRPVQESTARLEDCVTDIRLLEKPMARGAGSLFSLQHYLFLLRIKVTEPKIFVFILAAAIAILLVVTGTHRIIATTENLILTWFLIYMLCEFCTPALRNPYMLIEYLGVLGVFMRKVDFKLILLAVMGLAFNHDFPIRVMYQREIGEAMLLLAIYLAVFNDRAAKSLSK